MPKEIRVEVRVKNNLILSKMEAFGIGSAAELCRLIGKPKQQSRVGDLINMKEPARNKDGTWCQMALDLATYFRCLPEDLFSDFQQEQALDKNRASAEIGFAEFQQIAAARQTPEIAYQQTELHQAVLKMLGTLTAREERVLRLRFGFDGPDMTLEAVAELFGPGVTRERIRQIESKALRKLMHPSRHRQARAAIENVSDSELFGEF